MHILRGTWECGCLNCIPQRVHPEHLDLTKFPLTSVVAWAVEGEQQQTPAWRKLADMECTQGSSRRFGSQAGCFSAAPVPQCFHRQMCAQSPSGLTHAHGHHSPLSLSPLRNTTGSHERRNYFCMKWKGPECRIRTESVKQGMLSPKWVKKIQM